MAIEEVSEEVPVPSTSRSK